MDGGGIFFIKKVHKKLAFLFLIWYNVIEDKEKDGLKRTNGRRSILILNQTKKFIKSLLSCF